MKLLLIPDGWPCTLEKYPPGPFLTETKSIGFKSEYHTEAGRVEAFNDAGEFFQYTDLTMVQPLVPRWENT